MKKFGKTLMLLLMAGALIGCEKQEEEKKIGIYEFDAAAVAGVDFTLENDSLRLDFDPATTLFTVTDKSNGKVWHSTAQEVESHNADTTSKMQLQSNLVVQYKNSGDVRTYVDTKSAVDNGYYDVEKKDDTIRVRYSVGKIQKTYIIPIAVPDARMHQFYDQMDTSTKRKIENWYRCYDINNLLASDKPDELKEKYPDIGETKVWVLRDATKPYQKEQLEEWFAAVGYNDEERKADVEHYPSTDTSNDPQVNLTMVLRLEGDSFVVEIPNNEIEYRTKYPVSDIQVLPYFGSGSIDDEGFMLVPEGSGAIINFNNGKVKQPNYYADVYGFDFGNKKTELVNETKVAIPVFGIGQPDGSFISVVEKYSTTASICADISGKSTDYNSVYAYYEMIHSSEMDISGKSDSTVMAFEKELPEGGIIQKYIFTDGSSYVDMARAYQNYLIDKYPTLTKNTDPETPVTVEFLGAIKRVKQILGVPVDRPDALTTFSQAKNILQDMLDNGYRNISVRYTGWMNGGLLHSIPKKIKLVSGMGGKKALKDLIYFANNNDIDLYLSGHVENSYDSDIFDGYIKSRDVAKYLSREAVEIPEFSHIFFSDVFEERVMHHFLLRPTVCISLMESMADYANKMGAGVGFEDIGNLLCGDYNIKRETTREKSMEMQVEELAKIKEKNVPIMVAEGNQYVLPYADIITDMDFQGKFYTIFDYSVPFYQIAIHGIVNYTGEAINLAGDPVDVILKSAEAGAGLSFLFMNDSVSELQNTEYTDFFGAHYDSWKNIAKEYYTRYKSEMDGLYDKFITDHKVLADGVSATTYENGTVVYVNYNETPYSDGKISIPARDYLVERRGK